MMRAGDITVGWYHAHGASTADLEVISVLPSTTFEGYIDITYHWKDKTTTEQASPNKEWNITRPEYVINELDLS